MHVDHVLFGRKDKSLLTIIPSKQLQGHSLQVIAPGKQFKDWSARMHAESYRFLQRIAQGWKNSHFTDQYLIYGKIDANIFRWEIVPYRKCRTCIGRIVQQLQVIWRTVFGGITVSKESCKQQSDWYHQLLSKFIPVKRSSRASTHDDAFCKQGTIDRQRVIEGKRVNVLFSYAPIGYGGEKLHFLIIPKDHCEMFTDITQEEYCESLSLTKKLIDHFTNTRNTIKNVYLYHKTGIDLQTVRHWHLHVIFSANTAQDFWGKITIIKNTLIGSSAMKNDDLVKKVSGLRKELADLAAHSH